MDENHKYMQNRFFKAEFNNVLCKTAKVSMHKSPNKPCYHADWCGLLEVVLILNVLKTPTYSGCQKGTSSLHGRE